MTLPLGERGGVQESWITLDDTVVAFSDSTAPGTGEKDVRYNFQCNVGTGYSHYSLTSCTNHPPVW